MPNALCAAFSKVSIDTWHRVEEGRNLYWLGEETLTDLLIRDLLRLRLPGFDIQAFHKKQERENGADWEWWFQGNCGNWIGMRVQAKVIHQDVDKFKELHRSYRDEVTGAKTYQSDILVSSAKTGHFPCIPIYCLYSHWVEANYNKLLPVWVSHLDSPNFGCSIITAAAVQCLRKITPTKKANRCDLKETIGWSIPLAGLVCSPFVAKGSIAERVQDVLQVDNTYLLPSPPPYVTLLMERGRKQASAGVDRIGIEIDLPTGIVGILGVRQSQR